MTNNQDRITKLNEMLEVLMKRQISFSQEINRLSEEINQLKLSEESQFLEKAEIEAEDANVDFKFKKKETKIEVEPQQQFSKKPPIYSPPKVKNTPKLKSDLEKFIGENLINKIGIAITVIGVGIGAKYTIEHDLISPLTRIILGYMAGLVLLGFGIKLKNSYHNYSAVLVSGAMAILYFITYAAYSFYDLFPQIFAFVIMVIFTAFTVFSAINYNRQVIAHIGLVGAYAVPFLLSESPDKVATLFSFIAIINIGILVIAFKKNWKPLYYASFLLTWLMYFLWFTNDYQTNDHFGLALIFLGIFFTVFYVTFLAFNLLHKEKFVIKDIILLLANAFIFYGLGYVILNDNATGAQLLGLFTLGNAIVHFIVAAIIFQQKLADRNLFYLISGLVLVFITISFPVQLDGNWVTLLWAGEAVLLFWIGRTKNIPIYEILSYPLMVLAFFSIFQDWELAYGNYNPDNPETRITPLLNIYFLTSILVMFSFGFITFIDRIKKYTSALVSRKDLQNIFFFSVPAIFIFILYSAFSLEIANYWNQLFEDSVIAINVDEQQYHKYNRNFDLLKFQTIWILNYSLLFFAALSFVNLKWLKNRQLGLVNLVINSIVLLFFLLQGLYVLGELRESYLEQTLSEYYHRGIFNIGIRYISFSLVAVLFIICFRYIHQEFMKKDFTVHFDLVLYISIIWVTSCELITWMDIAESTQSDKLGLSILWGIYSLLLIALGIWKRKKHIRIGAFALFAVTLIKLFFYDLTQLDTISKTILFVSLGVLLLIISFLYNKYRKIISDEH